jgi:hypothetical protein
MFGPLCVLKLKRAGKLGSNENFFSGNLLGSVRNSPPCLPKARKKPERPIIEDKNAGLEERILFGLGGDFFLQ